MKSLKEKDEDIERKEITTAMKEFGWVMARAAKKIRDHREDELEHNQNIRNKKGGMEMKERETVKSFLSRNALWRLHNCLAGRFSFQHEEERKAVSGAACE
jgi:transcriptional regulator with GAF, ATPase, and Fis domain